jgi:hypothetical protein
MSRGKALAALSVLTAEQWGMVTAAQVRWLGVSRVDIGRLLADGALERVAGAARVYRLAGSPPDPELDPLRGAWLQLCGDRPAMLLLADPGAVTSHRSAAIALGLGDVIASVHEFYVTCRRQPRRADLRLRGWGTLGRDQWHVTGGLPVCMADRIVGDLLADREDESAVAGICQDAVHAGLLDPGRLAGLAAPHAAAYGAASGAALAARLLGTAADAGPGSTAAQAGEEA